MAVAVAQQNGACLGDLDPLQAILIEDVSSHLLAGHAAAALLPIVPGVADGQIDGHEKGEYGCYQQKRAHHAHGKDNGIRDAVQTAVRRQADRIQKF